MVNYFETTWYTDKMTIYRATPVLVGNITKFQKNKIGENIKCHIYTTSKAAYNGSETSNTIQESNQLSCNVNVDIKDGDEIEVTRYKTNIVERYIAGNPANKVSPYGHVDVGLDHKEVPLLMKERA